MTPKGLRHRMPWHNVHYCMPCLSERLFEHARRTDWSKIPPAFFICRRCGKSRRSLYPACPCKESAA